MPDVIEGRRRAGAERRAAVVKLKRAGLSFAQIGGVLEVSRQRAHFLWHDAVARGEVPALVVDREALRAAA
jgi:orotate phosphoribosyltransferase-like protein